MTEFTLNVNNNEYTVDVDDEKAEKLLKMLDVLEDSDDVQNVYANFEISESTMARLSG